VIEYFGAEELIVRLLLLLVESRLDVERMLALASSRGGKGNDNLGGEDSNCSSAAFIILKIVVLLLFVSLRLNFTY